MTQIKHMLEIAIKAEIDAADNYGRAADQTDLFLLRDKFHLLQNEEKGHRRVLEKLFAKKFTEDEPALPASEDMPFKEFSEYAVKPTMQPSEIIEEAMAGEQRARDFYLDMEKEMDGDKEKAIMRYLASMEESHYFMLKSELEMAQNFELYDEVHSMMHVGP